MKRPASRIAVQAALAHLRGRLVVKANATVGTSFIIDFAPLQRVPRQHSKRLRRWLGGYFTARTYLLFQGADWRIRFGKEELRTIELPHEYQDRLLDRIVGLRLRRAWLSGPGQGIKLEFLNGPMISIRSSGQLDDWWIGTRTGTVSPFEELGKKSDE